MYSSWSSAHFRPSSRVIAWFCASGSSVTRKVERFERLTTSVEMLMFPKRVGRAFGIRAVSSFASAGLGLSITEAAGGSRNAIFATRTPSLASRNAGSYRGSELMNRPLAAREGAVAGPAERGARKGGDAMNTTPYNAKQLREALVALVSVALLVAASPVYSAPSDGNTVACQSGHCGG